MRSEKRTLKKPIAIDCCSESRRQDHICQSAPNSLTCKPATQFITSKYIRIYTSFINTDTWHTLYTHTYVCGDYLTTWCCKEHWAFWRASLQAVSSFILFKGGVSTLSLEKSITAGGLEALTRSYSLASIGWSWGIKFHNQRDRNPNLRSQRREKPRNLGTDLEIGLGKWGQVFEEIGGLFRAASQLLLHHAVDLSFDVGVGVVVVDVRQGVDGFGVG